jgi:hypothetical protein
MVITGERDNESEHDAKVESEGDVKVLVTGYGVHDPYLPLVSLANVSTR